MGHVPAGPLPQEGAGAHLPRCEPRGSGPSRAAAARRRAQLARFGESLAASFLRRRGAVIVGRNVAVGADEIDQLASWDGVLVAVEVKTRLGGDPADAFTDSKARRFRRAGRGIPVAPARYDLVTVRLARAGAEVRWLPGVC